MGLRRVQRGIKKKGRKGGKRGLEGVYFEGLLSQLTQQIPMRSEIDSRWKSLLVIWMAISWIDLQNLSTYVFKTCIYLYYIYTFIYFFFSPPAKPVIIFIYFKYGMRLFHFCYFFLLLNKQLNIDIAVKHFDFFSL